MFLAENSILFHFVKNKSRKEYRKMKMWDKSFNVADKPQCKKAEIPENGKTRIF